MNEIYNNILKRLNSQPLGTLFRIPELSKASGIDEVYLIAICEKLHNNGYVSNSKGFVILLETGKLFIEHGGYKETISEKLAVAQLKDISENSKYRKLTFILAIVSIVEAIAIALITLKCKK